MKLSPATRWIGMIVGLLLMSVIINFVVIFRFAGDDSETLEAGWTKAQEEFPALLEQRTRNRELGWKVALDSYQSGADPVTFVLSLEDRQGERLSGGALTWVALPLGHPAERFEGSCVAGEGGLYSASLPAFWEGYWELRIEATHEGQTFTQTLKEYLKATPAN
ncbi:MAG: FixH family protein [Planctomycetota bacterium]